MASVYGLLVTFLAGVISDAILYALQPVLNSAVANAQASSEAAGAILGIVPVLLYAVPSWVPFALELLAFIKDDGA